MFGMLLVSSKGVLCLFFCYILYSYGNTFKPSGHEAWAGSGLNLVKKKNEFRRGMKKACFTLNLGDQSPFGEE